MTQSVLLLEDNLSRVRWLRETFPDLELHHAATVKAFIAMQTLEHADLVILDNGLPRTDDLGLAGIDAVPEMTIVTYEVLVWSRHPHWGPALCTALRNRCYKARLEPFDEKTMEPVLRKMLRSAW